MGASAIGSNLDEWVFTPVPSCSLLDMRAGEANWEVPASSATEGAV
jgi:hypothetical protein